MAKSAKRRPAAPNAADPRTLAKQHEKRVLTKYLREVRAVNQLARKLKRDVEKADDNLRSFAVWLGAREWQREATGEHADKRQAEPANT